MHLHTHLGGGIQLKGPRPKFREDSIKGRHTALSSLQLSSSGMLPCFPCRSKVIFLGWSPGKIQDHLFKKKYPINSLCFLIPIEIYLFFEGRRWWRRKTQPGQLHRDGRFSWVTCCLSLTSKCPQQISAKVSRAAGRGQIN